MKKFLLIIVLLGALAYAFGPWLLTRAGEFLVVEERSDSKADAVVVLTTGVDYLPRLMQAAELYRQGQADLVVINGNRKTDVHRALEEQGYRSPHNWYDGSVSVLTFLGVDKPSIAVINAEDVYDTVSEAQIVGPHLEKAGVQSILVTTSKFHTRRALAIWEHQYDRQFVISMVPAQEDPFRPDGWWRDGRQIRQVLSEYGAWAYFWGKRLASNL